MSFSAAPITFAFQVQGDQEAKAKIQSVGGAFQQFGKTAETVNTQTEPMERNFKQAALGLSAAAASGASLYFQFDNLQKAELRVEQASKNSERANLELSRAQEALSVMVAHGISTGLDYEQAVQRVSIAQQQAAIASEKISLAQGDQNHAWTGFALNIVPSVIGMTASVTTAMSALGVSLTGAGESSSFASVALGFLRTAMTFIAMHPLILPLTAVATVLTLVATNAFGLRDALDNLGKTIESVFPAIKPVFDFFRYIAESIFPDTKKAAQDTQEGMTSQFQQIALSSSSTATTVEADVKKIKTAMESLQMDKTSPQDDNIVTVPNPLGGTYSYVDPKFGGSRISELRNQFKGADNTQATIDRINAASTIYLKATVNLDGKKVGDIILDHAGANLTGKS